MYLSFRSQNHCIALQTPTTAMRSVALARLLLLAPLEDREEKSFDGCLLWLRDWEIGSPELEIVGWRVLQALRGGSEGTTSLRAAPASLFGGDELVDAHVALVQPLIFRWDAYLISESGEWFGFVHHHETTYFVARTQGMLQHVRGQLRLAQWATNECSWPP
jgi:hypothetical protein